MAILESSKDVIPDSLSPEGVAQSIGNEAQETPAPELAERAVAENLDELMQSTSPTPMQSPNRGGEQEMQEAIDQHRAEPSASSVPLGQDCSSSAGEDQQDNERLPSRTADPPLAGNATSHEELPGGPDVSEYDIGSPIRESLIPEIGDPAEPSQLTGAGEATYVLQDDRRYELTGNGRS